MSNSTILASVSTLVATVVTDLATLASAQSNVATLQASLATAQATLAADLADGTTSSSTLIARIPGESALVLVLETQLALAIAAVATAQAAVYSDAVIAGGQAQAICRQWRSFQKSADQTTLLNFVDPNKMRLGSTAIYDVLAASAADTVIANYYAGFATQNVASIPQVYPNVVNISSNWSAFETAINAVGGLTLTSP
jgi:hypothetical protein